MKMRSKGWQVLARAAACAGLMLTQAFGQALDKVPPAPPTPPPPPKLPPVPNVRTNRDVAAILAAARAKASNAPAQTLTATQVPPQNLVQALSAPAPVATPAIATPPTAIVWDSEFKEKTASYGDTNAVIVFWLTNTSSAEVVVNSVRPSCGCTVAKLPSQPWRIGPGESGPIEASLDLRGKSGTLTKSLYVDSSSGPKTLLFKVTIPDRQGAISMSDPDRIRNVQLATADRQVVFKNADCAKCHAEPAHGKFGAQLYQAACAICHDTPHRATMVPDLRALKHPTNADTWRAWIKYGRVGSLMPAFDQSQGGPLTDDQIESLVNYLVQTIPSAPLPAAVPAKASPTAAAGTDHSATHTVSGAR